MFFYHFPQNFFLVVCGESLGDIVLLREFIVELERIAPIAVDLLSLLLAAL
jgi:hypothetical protein